MLQFYCRPMAFALPVGQLTITTPALLPPAQFGLPYSQFVDAVGGVPPYTWSLLAVTGPDNWTVTNPGGDRGLISGNVGLALRSINGSALRSINGNALRAT